MLLAALVYVDAKAWSPSAGAFAYFLVANRLLIAFRTSENVLL